MVHLVAALYEINAGVSRLRYLKCLYSDVRTLILSSTASYKGAKLLRVASNIEEPHSIGKLFPAE